MIVVLDNIRSAYNVGSIIRTCDGAGVNKVVLCGYTKAEGFKVGKTALGAEENILIEQKNTMVEFIESINRKEYCIVGIEEQEKSLDIFEFCTSVRIVQNDLVLILGNEVSGISKNNLDLCDYIVEIPMVGIKNSLNVSNAAAIAIYLIKFLKNSK